MPNIDIEFAFRARSLRGLIAAVMVLSAASDLASESVTMTTYYPAPSGVYTQMIVTGNTYLARDAGQVGIATSSPTATLDVNGSVLARNSLGVGTASVPPPATLAFGNKSYTQGAACSTEGTFAYDYIVHQPIYCGNTGKWQSIGGSTAIGATSFLNPYNGTGDNRGSYGWITGNNGSGLTFPGVSVANIGKNRTCLAAVGSWGESNDSQYGAGCRYDPASGSILASTINASIVSCIWICTN